jgi:hypothetical protein
MKQRTARQLFGFKLEKQPIVLPKYQMKGRTAGQLSESEFERWPIVLLKYQVKQRIARQLSEFELEKSEIKVCAEGNVMAVEVERRSIVEMIGFQAINQTARK